MSLLGVVKIIAVFLLTDVFLSCTNKVIEKGCGFK